MGGVKDLITSFIFVKVRYLSFPYRPFLHTSRFRDPESEIVMNHVVVPPLSDSKKLGISEYRSRLYDVSKYFPSFA